MPGWYYARGKQKFGPFSPAQFKHLADTGQIHAGEMVLREGTSQWVPAGSLPGLFAKPSRRFWTCERIVWAVFLIALSVTACWFFFQAESLKDRVDGLESSTNRRERYVRVLEFRLAEELEKRKAHGADTLAPAAELKKQISAAQKQAQESQTTIAGLKEELAEARKKKEPPLRPTGPNTQTLPAINAAILDFSLKNLGKQVSNGECAMLAMEAIKIADARPMRPSGKTYIWGRPLDKTETVLPGDIVQLEDCKFKNGAAPHHTQIVRTVLGKGRFEILEQNANGRRTVNVAILDLNLLTQGEVVFYRPLPKNSAAN
jgi:hypothetical protein